MADIDGDAGDNSINGTSSDDNIKGKGGQDTLDGNSGDDTISGESGNDSIDGGGNNDTIFGGDGDDTITGGSGDDIIVGGRGDDVLSAGDFSTTDTFVIRDGDGNDTITDFDPPEPDIVRFDMDEMSTFQDVLDRITTDGPDTVITYDNGSTLRLQNTDPADLTATNFEFGAGPVCLGEGTMIDTPNGARPIEELKKNDLVTTLDHGPQSIVDVVVETVQFRGHDDRRKPILIPKGALGAEGPNMDTVSSPQHRFLVHDQRTDQMVLLPAIKLTGRKGVRRMKGVKQIKYYNLLMDRHEIIFANGSQVETLLVSPNLVPRLRDLKVALDDEHVKMDAARPLSDADPQVSSAS
ncbi:MAG: Hint domain-containing protein [Paracoccaceae bacterium]